MSSLFSKIVSGEIPSFKIAEDEQYYSFLTINPIRTGHTLVIPKKETDYIFDLEDAALAGLVVYAKKVAKAVKKAFPCRKIAVVVYGLEVPHAHVHLIPVDGTAGEIDFRNAKKAQPHELEEAAK